MLFIRRHTTRCDDGAVGDVFCSAFPRRRVLLPQPPHFHASDQEFKFLYHDNNFTFKMRSCHSEHPHNDEFLTESFVTLQSCLL